MNRTILITGATGKIGRIFVRHFLAVGDRVIAIGRTEQALAALTADHSQFSTTLNVLQVDLLAVDATRQLIDGLKKIDCMPNCVINNARNVAFLNTQEDGTVSREDFLNEFMLDVVAPYELVMSLVQLPGSPLGAVVNIGSQYGSVAPNLKLYNNPLRQSPLQYGVAKAALAHLTKELAVRLADRGIRVNCIAFGGVEGRVDEAFKQRYAALCPMGRMLSEDELAGPVDMLLSDAASAITGHTLMADGGWSLW